MTTCPRTILDCDSHQVIGRRRKLLKDMGDNMAIEVSAGLSGSGFEGTSVRMLAYHLAKDALAQPVMWYV